MVKMQNKVTCAVPTIPFTLGRVAGFVTVAVSYPVGGAAFVAAWHRPR
jgi:hypothetical protein